MVVPWRRLGMLRVPLHAELYVGYSAARSDGNPPLMERHAAHTSEGPTERCVSLLQRLLSADLI